MLFTPYYAQKKYNLKFYTPNVKVLGRSKGMLSSEPDTIEWINSFNKSDVFLDIGANIGTYSMYAGSRGNQVISVEPLWTNYSVLCDNIIANNFADKIVPLNIALTDRVKIENLSISSIDSGSSHNSIDSKVSQSAMINIESILKVLGNTIDNMWELYDLPVPNHIKIDVDGIEERVVYGGRYLFEKHEVRSILVECSLLEVDSCNNIINFFSSIGFRLELVSGIRMNFVDIRKLNGCRGSGGTLNLIFFKIPEIK